MGLGATAAPAQSPGAAPPPPMSLFGSNPGLTAPATTPAPATNSVSSWAAPTPLFGGKSAAIKQTASQEPSALPAMDSLTQPIVPDGRPGTIYSPWVDGQGVGGMHGPVTYEPYLATGPSILFGGGELRQILKTGGWTVEGGVRTLLFESSRDRAWVLNLGLSFTQHDGRGFDRTANAFTRGDFPSVTNQQGQQVQDSSQPRLPDVLTNVAAIRLNRTSLNYGLGRDYFLNGPGTVPEETFGNIRAGWDFGGRYGTASLSYIPEGDPTGYRRRQDVYHGIYLGGQVNWEKPFRSWTLLIGGRLEYSSNWLNVLPPQTSNLQDLNLKMLFGVRF